MRILVTGGAGFIGSHVVDAYVEAGHEVVVLDDLSTGRPGTLNARAAFHRVDLNSPLLDDLFRDRPFDLVNHHAAQVDVRRSVADPVADAGVNITGTIRLLERCRRSGVRGIILASTGGAIYGEHSPVPTPEDAPARPISPYGISKLAGERSVEFYHGVQGMPAVIPPLPLSRLFYAMDRIPASAACGAVQLAVLVGAGLLLIPRYGAWGAAWTSLLVTLAAIAYLLVFAWPWSGRGRWPVPVPGFSKA